MSLTGGRIARTSDQIDSWDIFYVLKWNSFASHNVTIFVVVTLREISLIRVYIFCREVSPVTVGRVDLCKSVRIAHILCLTPSGAATDFLAVHFKKIDFINCTKITVYTLYSVNFLDTLRLMFYLLVNWNIVYSFQVKPLCLHNLMNARAWQFLNEFLDADRLSY